MLVRMGVFFVANRANTEYGIEGKVDKIDVGRCFFNWLDCILGSISMGDKVSI